MKGLLLEVTAEELAQRKLRGLDRWDEMWEGVLHMAPAPAYEHQRILVELLEFLGPLLKRKRRGTLACGINVFREGASVEDYRIPDLTFIAAGHETIISPDGIRGGGPDAVIEIRSPEDETYEKLPFFAALGVREALVVDRTTKQPEVFRLAGAQYVAVAPDRDGWVISETLSVRLRVTPGATPLLVVEDVEEPPSRTEI